MILINYNEKNGNFTMAKPSRYPFIQGIHVSKTSGQYCHVPTHRRTERAPRSLCGILVKNLQHENTSNKPKWKGILQNSG